MAMTREQEIELEKRLIELGAKDFAALSDAFELARNADDHEHTDKIRRAARRMLGTAGDKALELWYRCHLFDARLLFDSFIIYTEKNRDYQKQFYLPRRKQLKQIVDAMQELADHALELLAISLPPGTGKSTIAMFYITWLAGKHPEKPILTGSHANSFLNGAYAECLRMMDPNGDYLWHDVFPDVHVINTNAKDMLIDVGESKRNAKRFPTLEFSSVGSGNAGKVRAEQLLYCDDLIPDLETALSRDRLEKLWGQYTTDLRQRKIGDCVELHIATRWSVRDVIGRLEQMYGENGKSKFIVIPALNENDESNFDYPIEAGFTTKFYHDQREIMDDASWRALYMNQPIEREGLLYSESELRRYFELPDGEPDAILSVCDTKDKGTDYCVMPIVYQYGQDYYVEDVVCDNSNPEIVEPRLVNKCLQHKIHMSRFESNSAGGRVAEKVQNEVKAHGGRTKITTKYTTQNKETKIIMAEPFVKAHFLFKDSSVIKDNKDLEKNSYFYSDLRGCKVIDESKNVLGNVKEVEEFPAQVTLRVKRDNKPDFFVPFIKEFIKEVDIDEKTITIHVLEGML